ncbi:MAG TPA: peptide chain release factor N(5)-glutamine methyltransferase [Candidatus Saccharimonadales bacterium]|nr:peptide chain release factor N(5)-glutamine methyltransferase [Candidatus Saccharimonadales bacterium]
MSANSLPKMPKLNEWLQVATRQLAGIGINSARLDAEIILAHTLRKSRTYLHAHNDDVLDPRHLEIADARLQLRLDHTPVAYIIGHKEFYGRLFRVTPATLIPRPESEVIIDLLKQSARAIPPSLLQETIHLIDVGTGSGCLGITAKLECPELSVVLSDVSKHALKVAEQNAANLKAEVTFIHSNLLENYPLTPTFILANLPYVDPTWKRSPETNHEPSQALFAKDDGLELINKLLEQAQFRLKPQGHLILEADPRQHASILKTATGLGFQQQTIQNYIVHLQKA